MPVVVAWRAIRWVRTEDRRGWKVAEFHDYPDGGWREAVRQSQMWHDPDAIERGELRVKVDPLLRN